MLTPVWEGVYHMLTYGILLNFFLVSPLRRSLALRRHGEFSLICSQIRFSENVRSVINIDADVIDDEF